MANQEEVLDGVLTALADPIRRQVVARLGHGPTSVSVLAEPFPIALPSFMKHVHRLERSGLIHTTKSGRVRTCTLNQERLAALDDWLAEQRRVWQARTDRLEAFVTDQEDSP